MSNSLEGITKVLEQSLSPQTAKESEKQLKAIEIEQGFSITLLHIVASTNLSASIRLAAALYFKNLIKRRWINEDGIYLLPIEDVNKIKNEILEVMIKLPSNLQVQIGESITLIAESDFPHNWPNLIDNLVLKLSLTDFVNNKSILLVSHSIFKKWRPLFRSDELFLEIKLVLEKFVEPFLQLFVEIDRLIQSSDNQAQLEIYFENLLLLIQIYYDFNCQDIPEFFEDHMNELMSIIHRYLVYTNDSLVSSSDEEVSVLIKVKTSIVELLSLYVTRYADVFEPLIQTFITSVWELINNYVTKQQKYDLLVVKALQFLTSIIKIPNYQSLFQNESSINEIIEKIILPNIMFRENDEELFEDEPILYVRSDLEGSDFDSRRKSATDFLRELKELNSELLTNSVMKYVNQFLSASSSGDWKNKDTAIYLFSSLATKGSVTNIGVTSTNVLVDVVKFFSDNIANDLESGNVHPILQVDAVKYIYTFRNQLTKDQLLITIPRLINHLNVKSNPVVYTYSAITIEKLLSMTNFSQNHTPVFNKTDIEPFTSELLSNLFNLILSSTPATPEKLAENEFLIKCIMRVLSTSEDLLTNRLPIIEQLIKILKVIAKNPSNPKFSHYIFESLGLLIKYGITQENINQYIELIIPELLNILSEDVQEFVPYTFQILAYLLERYPVGTGLPETYKSLIEPLMSPSVWQFKGNIPGITRLLISIIEHDPYHFKSDNIIPLLGVYQNLLASKVNDNYGFDLVNIILLYIPLEVLQPFLNNIAKVMLTRLQKSRTEKFVKRFTLFINNLNCTPNSDSKNVTNVINGDFVIKFIENVQIGLFNQIYQSFILPTSKILNNLQDKKIVNIGLSLMAATPNFELVLPTIETLIENLKSYEGLRRDQQKQQDNATHQPLNELDLDLTSFGSNYSKIISIENTSFDPLSMIKNNDIETIKLIIIDNLKKVDMAYLNQLPVDLQNDLKQLGFV